jgi:ribosomal protein L11 methylase PrmA
LKDAAELLDLPPFEKQFVEEDRLPYGLELWPASLMLAEAILCGERGDGRTALELGCGVGLVSIAATLAGWHVHATDHDPMALRFAQANAERNGVTVREFGRLDWRNPPEGRRYDRIFGADILYQLIDHEPILSCIGRLLAPDGTAMLADPCRGVADRVPELARQKRFHVEQREASAPNHLGQEVIGRLFVLNRMEEDGTLLLRSRRDR